MKTRHSPFLRRSIYRHSLAPVLILMVVLSGRQADAQGFFYVRDSFAAITNALLETHNPDVGLAGSWYRLLGQGLRIVQNALRPVANNTDELYGSNTSAGQAEYGIGVSVLFTTKQADPNCLTGFACTDHYGLLWGRGDVTSLNGYFARVTASGQVVILMNNRGTTTLLASTVIAPPPINIAHPMVFAMRNSVKEVYWDGLLVLSTTDNTLTGSSSTLLKNGLGARSTVSGGTVLDDFFLSPFPTLTGVSPTSGPPGGGQIMQVTGANVNGCYARVAGTVAQGISGSVNNEVFYSPPHEAGIVTVDCATAYTFGVKIPLYAPSLPNAYTYTPTFRASQPLLLPLSGAKDGPTGVSSATTLQLHNTSDQRITERLILHAEGGPFTATDPGVAFMIFPHATAFVPSLNDAMLASGLGAVELRTVDGPPPVAVTRFLPDAGAPAIGGDVEAVSASVGIGEGGSGVLLAPPDAKAAGFNISVRTFQDDSRLRFDVRNAVGRVIQSSTQDFPANTFVLSPPEDILGTALTGGESITATTESGFAMVYGASNDTLSQDVDIQRAARLPDDPATPPSRMMLPLAVSSPSPEGSFRTSAQLYNPTSSPMELRFAFLPEGGTTPLSWCNAPSCSRFVSPLRGRQKYQKNVVLAPGETQFIADLVQFQSWVGLGSMDIMTSGAGMPVMNFRVYRNSGDTGNGGTAGALIGAVDETAALVQSDVAALIAPSTTDTTRMDLGVRALDHGASLEFTLRDSDGNIKDHKSYVSAPGSFHELSTSDIFTVPLGASDSIDISVLAGAAIVYGVSSDSKSGDTSYQLARAQ